MMEAWQSSATAGSAINPLASGGDAHYLDESIHPSTIRGYFTQANNPSNPTSMPNLIRGMKWLLASMSKGRNVSDFFPHVVKLTGATSLEVRKMVYMYLVEYSDHDDTCRELALLSINSFQRGLADAEQLIRALALRALTSVRVEEIIHIQILAVQTCALSDRSPYVRKCAANALSKLWRGYGGQKNLLDSEQRNILLDILQKLLLEDTSTMVLSSAIIAFSEMCDSVEQLNMLHGCYRKICHLLTDMDEWGQVVSLEVLQRYCRANFTDVGEGSAVAFDKDKSLRRNGGEYAYDPIPDVPPTLTVPFANDTLNLSQSTAAALPPHPRQIMPIKRRVVKKAFYSDEEDESTEEVDASGPIPAAMPPVISLPSSNQPNDLFKDEDDHLDEDHRLLLRSSIPLLKSRNSAVVLAVCRLHYYCGVSSVKTRSAMGKALVRIHRDKREIQYVVLTSIHTLCHHVPSAFTPYLHDFFVKAMDPSFTRQIKLDILASLALQPDAINAVLGELRTYIRHDDKAFVRSAVKCVGKMVELAAALVDKQTVNIEEARQKAITVALNALYGLQTFLACSRNPLVVGECVVTMRQILVQLQQFGAMMVVDDPNKVQQTAIKRLILVVLQALAPQDTRKAMTKEEYDDEDAKLNDDEELAKRALPPEAVAAALWAIGEFFLISTRPLLNVNQASARFEILRLAAKGFCDYPPPVKLQIIHLATKCIVMEKTGATSGSSLVDLCSYILNMAKLDVHHDVRDRARFESAVLDLAQDHPEQLSWQAARTMLVHAKPPKCSTLPIVDTAKDQGQIEFPFGTLSSLVGHKAGPTFYPLPPWAPVSSPSALRDPTKVVTMEAKSSSLGPAAAATTAAAPVSSEFPRSFYDSNDEEETEASSTSESSSDESSTEEEDQTTSSEDETTQSSQEQSQESEDGSDTSTADDQPLKHTQTPMLAEALNNDAKPPVMNAPPRESVNLLGIDLSKEEDSTVSDEESGDDETESESENSDASTEEEDGKGTAPEANLLSLGTILHTEVNESSGLEDLVMAPLVVDGPMETPDLDRDSSAWTRLVRHELAGGLEVQQRFLRGASSKQEANLLKLPEGTVIVQLKFENM